jgi:L-iditol 2-dehydrogenase
MPAPNEPIELRDVPAPELQPGAALLHTLYSEVCGTDVHLHHGRLAGVPYPIVPGHVSVGAIAALRGPVVDVHGEAFREGDVVTFLDVHETCNHCYHCLVAKQPTRCASRRVYGITYGLADGLLGGWSEAIWMKPGVKMVRLPDGLEPEVFIGGGCGLMTALHALDIARIQLGESVSGRSGNRWSRSRHSRAPVRSSPSGRRTTDSSTPAAWARRGPLDSTYRLKVASRWCAR